MPVTNRQLRNFFENVMNFDTYNNAEYLMTANNMAVGLNMPPALKSIGSGANEIAQGLPPHAPRRAFLVDEYPACPANWMRSSGRTKSYFVPIKVNHGLWLDFNMSLHRVAQDVAIVVSAQGVNAITGLPARDPQLEQFLDVCPKHKEAFGPDRLCTKCGFKWPKCNYLSSTGQPLGSLWIDGFRAEDGIIRQYVFTEDHARSVAKAIVGEDRVFALGISYFLSKTNRVQPTLSRPLGHPGVYSSIQDQSYSKGLGLTSCVENYDGPIACASGPSASNLAPDMTHFLGNISKSANVTTSWGHSTASASKGSSSDKGVQKLSARLAQDDAKGSLLNAPSASKGRLMASTAQYCANTVAVKKVEIAAGAKVNQRFYDDPNSLDYWQAEPTALIVINYCTEEDAERIIAAGKVDLSGHPEGFLQQVPSVGNP